MTLTVVDNDSGFDELKTPWEKLQTTTSVDIFQHWSTNRLWWQIHRSRDPAARLHILCYWKGATLVLVLPTWISGDGTLRFLQSGASDRLDVICLDPRAAHAALGAVAEHMQSCAGIAQIRLTNLPGTSPLIGFLPYRFKKTPYLIFQSDTIAHIDKDLFDERRVLSHLGSKRANDLRNIRDRMDTRVEVLDVSSKPFPEETIVSLLDKMERTGERDRRTYDLLLPFCQALYEHGTVKIVRQVSDEGAVGASAVVELNTREFLIWLDFYDPLIKNVNLKNYIDILSLAHRNQKAVNLGTGPYPYKVRNFAPALSSLYTFHFERRRGRFVYYHLRKTIAKSLGVV